MLPTVTPATPELGVPGVSLPCTPNPTLHESRSTRQAAARVCAACPLASPCLLQGLREDIAYRHGQTKWAPLGVRGGVWFEPGALPRGLQGTRVGRTSHTRSGARGQ